MIKLTKKIEYSIIALNHIGTNEIPNLSTVKEIAFLHKIPRELLAKILQKLTQNGYLRSVQGPKGGYLLSRPLNEIRLNELIDTIEGETGLIECISKTGKHCVRFDECDIRIPLSEINNQLNRFFRHITMKDILDGHVPEIHFEGAS